MFRVAKFWAEYNKQFTTDKATEQLLGLIDKRKFSFHKFEQYIEISAALRDAGLVEGVPFASRGGEDER